MQRSPIHFLVSTRRESGLPWKPKKDWLKNLTILETFNNFLTDRRFTVHDWRNEAKYEMYTMVSLSVRTDNEATLLLIQKGPVIRTIMDVRINFISDSEPPRGGGQSRCRYCTDNKTLVIWLMFLILLFEY